MGVLGSHFLELGEHGVVGVVALVEGVVEVAIAAADDLEAEGLGLLVLGLVERALDPHALAIDRPDVGPGVDQGVELVALLVGHLDGHDLVLGGEGDGRPFPVAAQRAGSEAAARDHGGGEQREGGAERTLEQGEYLARSRGRRNRG
ncbi:hypothetical protein D3C86_1265640 [compost metagenome]